MKRTTIIILLASLPAILVGCSTTPTGRFSTAAAKSPNNQVRRIEYTKGNDLKRVRTPEFVKTYHLGRTASRSGSTMHEAHRVYKVEKSARWNLARGNPPLSSGGPVVRLVDGAFKPLPESEQLRAEYQRQREITNQIEAARDRLSGTIAQMKAKLAHDRDATKMIGKLRGEKAELEAEIENLRSRLNIEVEEPKAPDNRSDALKKWGEQQADNE